MNATGNAGIILAGADLDSAIREFRKVSDRRLDFTESRADTRVFVFTETELLWKRFAENRVSPT